MAYALILLPILMAAVAMAVSANRWRPWLLPVTAVAHMVMTGVVLAKPDLAVCSSWLVLDPPGRLVLLLISVLFGSCSFYTVDYLRHRQDRSNRVFCACLLAFLSVMTLVAWSHHLGLMWVAVEATTITSAFLVGLQHSRASLEASWKYILIGSVGIALCYGQGQ